VSFSDLTRNQKQYFALGGIVAAGLVVLVVFGIRLSLSSIRTAKGELEEVSGKIEKAERSLARRSRTEKDLAETSAKLGGLLENLPPERNYFSWATEVIYSAARASELEIDAIDEQTGAAKAKPKGKAAGSAIKLESYSLRITARGGFRNVKAFLALLEREQPLACITGVDIGSTSNPEIHDVQIFVQWPFNLGAITDALEAVEARKESLGEVSPEEIRGSETKQAKGAKR
jgi:hypothetical protein